MDYYLPPSVKCYFNIFITCKMFLLIFFNQKSKFSDCLASVFCSFHFSEKLKFGLLAETKAWRLHYSKFCNTKYRNEMERTFEFIDDLNKRLSRPMKDLDDIRFAMSALKEIREKEIMIDMNIGPIEVSVFIIIFNNINI